MYTIIYMHKFLFVILNFKLKWQQVFHIFKTINILLEYHVLFAIKHFK